MEQQCVVFELQNESYGVDITAVESIIKMQDITILPHAASFIEGVTNLRGAIVPVIDLRKRFGMQLQAATRDMRIMIATMRGTKVGLVVDAVSQVIRIPEEAIEPPPVMSMTVNSSFIRAIAKLEDQMIILLDLDKVMGADEREALSY